VRSGVAEVMGRSRVFAAANVPTSTSVTDGVFSSSPKSTASGLPL